MTLRDLVGRLRRKLGLRGRLRGARAAVGRRVPALAPTSTNAWRIGRSRLFDLDWYNAQIPAPLGRGDAVRHYLTTGRAAGLTPHPLFDPETYRSVRPQSVGDDDPLWTYLRLADHDRLTHPLFDVRAYLVAHPAALDHADGLIGHFMDAGRHRAAAPNDWFTGEDFIGWLTAQRDLWVARRGAEPATGSDVEINEAIDWAALAARKQVARRTSVLIPTYQDWKMTTLAVERVAQDAEASGADVEIVVIDNGCALAASTALASLAQRFAATTIVANATNHGFALGNNLGLVRATGEFVVFLNNDTEAQPGWLAPLTEALADEPVLAAQSLLIFANGTIQSAGIAFPPGGGIPHEFLAGFPAEDADGIDRLSFQALTGAALAVRFADAVATHGFDPIYRNGMEDSDLCLRLSRLREGRMTVAPTSVVVHYESQTPGRFTASISNRQTFMDRWANDLRGDDADLWGAAGYDIVDHTVPRHGDDPNLLQRRPVLRRRALDSVNEAEPRLRWAIKIAAPARGEHWGDTHYARHLARHLRNHGQQVVIDFNKAFDRPTAEHDDVTLVLRGLRRHTPRPEHINLLWLISHPELLTAAEVAEFDHVFAASLPWAREHSARWQVRIDPLLQATDPTLFTPDVAEPDTGHPVLFVGGSRRQRRPMILNAVAAGLPLSVYGHEWERFVPAETIAATFLPNEQVPAAYRSAGFVLNDHWPEMRDEGFLSNRLFDAVGAGARVITDDIVGLGDVFGKNVQVAESVEDLRALVEAPNRDAIFGDDAYRRAEAERIHAEHSFVARAETLLAAALDVRRQRG